MRLEVIWLQLETAVMLLLGSAIIFVALARMDRPLPPWRRRADRPLLPGRRPDGANEREREIREVSSPFPSRSDVALPPTAPPPARGRALSMLLPRLFDEDLAAVRAARRQGRRVAVICLRTSHGNPAGFDDNRYGLCHECGERVQFRPHMPQGAELWCLECFEKGAQAGDTLHVSEKTAEEVARWQEGRPRMAAGKRGN